MPFDIGEIVQLVQEVKIVEAKLAPKYEIIKVYPPPNQPTQLNVEYEYDIIPEGKKEPKRRVKESELFQAF